MKREIYTEILEICRYTRIIVNRCFPFVQDSDPTVKTLVKIVQNVLKMYENDEKVLTHL